MDEIRCTCTDLAGRIMADPGGDVDAMIKDIHQTQLGLEQGQLFSCAFVNRPGGNSSHGPPPPHSLSQPCHSSLVAHSPATSTHCPSGKLPIDGVDVRCNESAKRVGLEDGAVGGALSPVLDRGRNAGSPENRDASKDCDQEHSENCHSLHNRTTLLEF